MPTCVLLEGGTVRCWGSNAYGQLGGGQMVLFLNSPGDMAPIVELGGSALGLAVGGQHNCALMDGGRVRCWGYNVDGQLGLGNTQTIGDDPGEMPSQDAFLYTRPE